MMPAEALCGLQLPPLSHTTSPDTTTPPDPVPCVIGVLDSGPAADQPADAELEALRRTLRETGVHFLGIDNGHAHLTYTAMRVPA